MKHFDMNGWPASKRWFLYLKNFGSRAKWNFGCRASKSTSLIRHFWPPLRGTGLSLFQSIDEWYVPPRIGHLSPFAPSSGERKVSLKYVIHPCCSFVLHYKTFHCSIFVGVEDFIQYFIVFIDTHYKHLQALLQTFICKRYLSHSEKSYKTV